jgi:lysophospholipase L1-like esterase
MRARPPLLAAAAALVLGACASSQAVGNGPQVDAQPGTSGEGRSVELDPTGSQPSTSASTTTVPGEPVLTDNRVYVVGDSITESISSRYSGAICDALTPLGWDITVDAVQGRRTSEAVQSLRAHVKDVGQVMVVLIGHNDGIDPTGYRAQLDRLFALVPDVRRIYLLTNYEFERGRDRMNAVVRDEAAADGTGGPSDRIELVDWNAVVDGVKGAIRSDGLHLTSVGQEALAGTIASALGLAPGVSAPATSTTVPRTSRSSGSSSVSSRTCRTERATGTSGSSRTSSGSGSSGSGGSGRTTTTPASSAPAPPTDPPVTTAPPSPPSTKPGKHPPTTTAPPGTNPPDTSPPGTAPPGT